MSAGPDPKSIQFGRPIAGKCLETEGQNEGPMIEEMKKWLGIPGYGISWCGIFVAWVLCRAYGLGSKIELRKALGYRSPFYADSTRDWLKQAMLAGSIVAKPERGDLFVLLDSRGLAHHIGFVVEYFEGARTVCTLEGNTNEGGSVNGNGVYFRQRGFSPHLRFISLPPQLKV